MSISLASIFLFVTAVATHAAHHTTGLGKKLNGVKLNPDAASMVQQLRHTVWSESVVHALHGVSNTSDACSNPAINFIVPLLTRIDEESLQLVQELAIDQIPLFYSILVNQDESNEYFGTFGEETQEIVLGQDALEEFWGSSDDDGGSTLVTDNILLLGMHGAVMKDKDKLVPTLEILYDLNGTNLTHLEVADFIQVIIESFPHEYDNPIFTFNAFASSDELFGGDRIVMGDGIIEYLHFMNLGSDGPEFVLSHEFGHQMQFEANITFDVETLPQSLDTRRFELMADALGGYFLAHPKGGNIWDYRVMEISKAAFSVGDCNVDSEGHHGTPQQRECAVIWGVNQAVSAADGGKVLHPDELRALFDADLSAIISLDESVCSRSFGSVSGGGSLPGDNRAAPQNPDETSTTTVTETVTNVTKVTTTETRTVVTKTDSA